MAKRDASSAALTAAAASVAVGSAAPAISNGAKMNATTDASTLETNNNSNCTDDTFAQSPEIGIAISGANVTSSRASDALVPDDRLVAAKPTGVCTTTDPSQSKAHQNQHKRHVRHKSDVGESLELNTTTLAGDSGASGGGGGGCTKTNSVASSGENSWQQQAGASQLTQDSDSGSGSGERVLGVGVTSAINQSSQQIEEAPLINSQAETQLANDKKPATGNGRKAAHSSGRRQNSSNKQQHRQVPIVGSAASGGGGGDRALKGNNTNCNINPSVDIALCKRTRRLSYLQSLLLRRWPCLALTICIMSSLVFGILLSALTVYFMHGVNDCAGSLALAALSPGAGASARNHHHHHHHELVARPAGDETGSGSPFDSAPAAMEAELVGRHLGAGNSAQSTGGSSGGDSLAPSATPTGAGELAKSRFERLPRAVMPEHYDLFIWPHIAEPFNFSGKVSIRLKCHEPTSNITLHSLDLNWDERSVALSLAGRARRHGPRARRRSAEPKVEQISQDKQLQHTIIRLDGPLEADELYELDIEFTGQLKDDLAGFYRIRYEQPNSTAPT